MSLREATDQVLNKISNHTALMLEGLGITHSQSAEKEDCQPKVPYTTKLSFNDKTKFLYKQKLGKLMDIFHLRSDKRSPGILNEKHCGKLLYPYEEVALMGHLCKETKTIQI